MTTHTQRHAAWRRANPIQAAEQDDAYKQAEIATAQLRAEGAPVDERVAVRHWLRAELDDIDRRYSGDHWGDESPHVKGV
jgi:hypothetical protein